MEILRPDSQTQSLEERDDLGMIITAELNPLKQEGIETYGDKVTFIYDMFGGPGKKDIAVDLVRDAREEKARIKRLTRMLGISEYELRDVFAKEVPEDLKNRIDATASFANALFRLEDRDYAKTLSLLTTKYPVFKKAPYSRYSPNRSLEDCLVQGEIESLLVNFEALLAFAHEEI